jgi:hypothetical protein
MEVIYHQLVVRDLRMALNYYELEGGTKLADRFFAEVEEGVAKIIAQPTAHYFSVGGYRRKALRSFPYHIATLPGLPLHGERPEKQIPSRQTRHRFAETPHRHLRPRLPLART